ncbi:sugar-specific transcriptional regulator TrmB/DNA-binding CsgD family transcriptional regulator [Actinoplanes lutulentus]|uniref:Sugar-specific transcriptional regulator TrmB n=1 Tax=Actinoplanes lutulentus TaxID=1287878 RepID=A0A327ZG52_9ACTN|nr:helix-turn-helix domain-containing protein [Actinoplanes lutulentus]MBB2942887.1 sugar-specific transcriptional regulator TrmB/DNA-binding CsgD family transcriptional regulator [Actinoplanes lutulentus]RAK38465.1 sugar-specific transcriptional regulator TrmB [Actinoplanes lutulentus]
MLPDVMGLDGDADAAYRALITVGSAGPDELAELAGFSATRAAELLDNLLADGLVARSLGDPGRFVAAPPGTALRAILSRRRHELTLAEAEIGALDELYRTATPRRGAPGVVEVVHGAAEVREMFGRLQLGAREEVLCMVKAPVAVIGAVENTAEDAAVARGVRYRVLLERAMLDEEPDTVERVVKARAAGEEIRIAAALPLKLIVVDREVAFLPLRRDPSLAGALLVHESGLLDALVALFEAEWTGARAVVTESGDVRDLNPGAIDDLDVRIVTLLMTGLTDEAVAAHLGTSHRTVQRRVRRLMDLTGGRTRMQLGYHAARLGWLD